WHLLIEAVLKRALGDCAGLRIGGVGARIVPEHVTRELIEHDRQCQRAIGGLLPAGKLSRYGRVIRFQETRADVVVERGVFLEPLFLPRRAPERQYGLRRGNHSRVSPLSMLR